MAGWAAVGQIAGDAIGTKVETGANRSLAREQQGRAEELSSTAYQRAVRDMKAAGLNPAMMYANGGSGASSPSLASATSGKYDFGSAVSTGLQSKRLTQELEVMKQTANEKVSNINYLRELANKASRETELIEANTGLARAQFSEAEANSKFWSNDASPMMKSIQNILRILGIGGGGSTNTGR